MHNLGGVYPCFCLGYPVEGLEKSSLSWLGGEGLLIRLRNFVSPSIMEKVKARLTKLKEAIDVCDERKNEAENSLTEARLRFETAESEKASFQRRIQLLKLELEKTVDRGEKKQTELDSLQCKTTQDELVVRELESLEVDGDEKLETLNVMVKKEQINAEDFDLQWREAERKLHVLQQDIERAENRFESSSLKQEEYTEKLASLGKRIKSLEQNESDLSEREQESEDKLVFLKDQQKEALVRADNGERDALRVERVMESLLLDIQNWKNKKADVLAEMESVSDLGDDI